MNYFKAQNISRRSNKPTESMIVKENLIADIWVGDKGLSWCFSRVNPNDATRSYRTLRPETLPECLDGLLLLSRVFSESSLVEREIQDYSHILIGELESLIKRMSGFSVEDDGSNGQTQSQSVFLTAAAK